MREQEIGFIETNLMHFLMPQMVPISNLTENSQEDCAQNTYLGGVLIERVKNMPARALMCLSLVSVS